MYIAALQKLQYIQIRFLLLCGNRSIIRSAFRSSAEVAVYSEMHIPAMGNRSIYNKTHISALLKSHYN